MDTQDSKQSILRVKKYVAPIHSHVIEAWLQSRQMDEKIIHQLPRAGWIVFDGEEPLAAGFLRMMEGGYAMIDGLISNPPQGLGNRRRSQALDLITERMISEGKILGLKKILAFSGDRATLKRSLRHGFVKQMDTMIVKEF